MVLHRNLLNEHLHEPKAHTHVEAEITDLNHFDPDAIHVNVADEIHSAFPIALIALGESDSFIIEFEDGGAWSKARLQWNTIKSELESQIGGPFLPLTAGVGEQISGELHLQDDLYLDADQKIYGANGHPMAWYQSLDDSMNFGTNGDIVRLKGSAVRPVYEQTPGIDKEIALLSDVAAGGAAVLRDGSLALTADWDSGAYRITTENLTVNNEILANEINELTPAAGVQIENVRFDDYDGSIGSITQVRDITLTGAIIRGDATLYIDSVRFDGDGDVSLPAGKALNSDVFSDSGAGFCLFLPDIQMSPGRYIHTPLLKNLAGGGLEFYFDTTRIAFLQSDAFVVDEDLKVVSGKRLYNNDYDTYDASDLVIYRDGVPKVTIGANNIEFQTGPIRVNGGLGGDLQVWDGAGWANAVYMNGATSMEFCDTDHECKLQGSEARPEYYPDGGGGWKDIALLEDVTTLLPIFHSLGYYSCAAAGGSDFIEWQDDIRKDAGYTHDEVTSNDEITLVNAGWYKITVDFGVEVNSLESAGEIECLMEYDDGGGWDDEAGWKMKIATPLGSEAENAHGTMVILYNFGAGDKIRFVATAFSTSGYAMNTDNDHTRITIEKVFTP